MDQVQWYKCSRRKCKNFFSRGKRYETYSAPVNDWFYVARKDGEILGRYCSESCLEKCYHKVKYDDLAIGNMMRCDVYDKIK